MPTEEHSHSCRTSPWKGKWTGRLRVTTPKRLQRLEVEPGCFSHPRRVLFNRSLCDEDQHSAPSVLQLAPRPMGTSSRCLLKTMEGPLPLPIPTLYTATSFSGQDKQRQGDSSRHCTTLAKPDLFSRMSGRHPSSPPINREHFHRPTGQKSPPSATGIPAAGCMVSGELSDQKDFLKGLSNILKKSWRTSTESAYSSAQKQLDNWCSGQGIDPLSAPIRDILEFLLHQFNLGKQCTTINTIRSAISVTLEEVDGSRVGQYPLVSRFLKEVYNSSPLHQGTIQHGMWMWYWPSYGLSPRIALANFHSPSSLTR